MRIVRLVLLAVLFVLPGSGSGIADTTTPPSKRVAFTRLVAKLPMGDQFIVLQGGLFCLPAGSKTWPGGPSEVKVAPFLDDFRTEFRNAGLNPEDEANLFDTGHSSSAQYALAGEVVEQHYTLCTVTGSSHFKGEASMTIEWQLFSRLEKKVVAKVTTNTTFGGRELIDGGITIFEKNLVGASLRQVAANPDIRDALSGAAPAADKPTPQPQLDRLIVPGALDAQPQPIDRAAQAVVMVYAGDGFGSGVLISRAGYLLTDAHVVGDASEVRIRWSDGKEGVASVVRTSKQRDVALLKADATGRAPLPLRTDPGRVGETVFAIGSPESQMYQGTVTKGIISANRVLRGYTYIQSDVTAGHGSSGGPLLDESGHVIGLTESGTHDATSSGIGLFTPIKDAIAFLNLDLR